MAFEQPAPDLTKIIAAWQEFEAGEQWPGSVLANMNTAGFPLILAQLVEQGWAPAA